MWEADMTIDWRPSRRAALLTPLAGAACAMLPTGRPADEIFRNISTPSESVHSGVCSPDGERRLTVRLCRYPELGLAWRWVHARTPRGFFSFIDHMTPCSRDATSDAGARAVYSDLGGTMVLQRDGLVTAPRAASIAGQVPARTTTDCTFGEGGHKLLFEIAFRPERLYAGLNQGRTEVFGHSRASVSVDGERFEIEGPAQFHEQRQSTPRFTQAFSYITLWGDNSASTLLITGPRREGYVFEGDKPTDVTHVRLDPPGQRRTFTARLKDGRELEGEGDLVQGYKVPIVGQRWEGHMVRARLDGKQLFGHMNDFLPDKVAYGG
jgi:hypothetical protein